MLKAHVNAFLKIATEIPCQIGLREPNSCSDIFIGDCGYISKPQECKAKPADDPRDLWSGLVISPKVHPKAFRDLVDASGKWEKFIKQIDNKTLIGYTVLETGAYNGLVRYHGKFIHADYDLSYICKAEKSGRLLFTSDDEEEELYLKVKRSLLLDIKIDMIRHRSESQWDDTGAKPGENVLHFGPNGLLLWPTSKQIPVEGYCPRPH